MTAPFDSREAYDSDVTLSNAFCGTLFLAFTVLPTLFVLGWFTIACLIDADVTNVVSLRLLCLHVTTIRVS